MAYINDLLNNSDGKIEYTITLVGRNHAIFEGFNDIIGFNSEAIRLRSKNAVAVISGSDLELSELHCGYICVRGKIAGVEYER